MHNLIRHSCEVYHLIPYIVVARELLPYNSRIEIYFRRKLLPTSSIANFFKHNV